MEEERAAAPNVIHDFTQDIRYTQRIYCEYYGNLCATHLRQTLIDRCIVGCEGTPPLYQHSKQSTTVMSARCNLLRPRSMSCMSRLGECYPGCSMHNFVTLVSTSKDSTEITILCGTWVPSCINELVFHSGILQCVKLRYSSLFSKWVIHFTSQSYSIIRP